MKFRMQWICMLLEEDHVQMEGEKNAGVHFPKVINK